jgi:glycosyltransferase involved in cell wall biosynthesis
VNIALDIRRRAGFGISTYVRNTVRALAEVDHSGGNRYLLVGTPDQLREFRNLPANFMLQPFPRPASSLASAMGFRDVLKKYRADLLHVPHLFKTPRFAPCPYVVTAHDVLDFIYLRADQTDRQSRLRLQLAKFALRRARGIIAVSNTTRDDVLRIFGIRDPQRVTVAYNAVDPKLCVPATDAERHAALERYSISYPFLLYAGSARKHKNIFRLVEAFAALKAEVKDGPLAPLRLIIIGDDISHNPELRRAAIRGNVQHDVRFLGFIPIEALRALYASAAVFVFPSMYEGFGLPPLEAMSQGTPVVCSNTAALPEVVGDAAVLVNPENIFEMKHAILRVLTDEQLQATLRIRGRDRAGQFSWPASAEKLLQFYARAVAG